MPAERPDAPRALSPWLEVRSGRRHGVLEVSVLGEIDLANHLDLRQLLDSLDVSGLARIDLDLTQLSFADARGASHLLDFADRGERSGCEVRILGAQHAVQRVIGLLAQLPDSA